jgi:hypothetical protein
MRLRLFIALCFMTTSSLHARDRVTAKRPSVQTYEYGVGLALGAGVPSGVTGVIPWTRSTFIQSTLGTSLGGDDISLSADYVWELQKFFGSGSSFRPYAGAGLHLISADHYDSLIGESDGSFHSVIRFPMGGYLILDGTQIQVFGEFIPGLQLSADTQTTLALTIGARWLLL